MAKRITLAGIEIKADDANEIWWMSDWTAWPAFVETGFFRSEIGDLDTYGHMSLYLTDAAIEVSRPAPSLMIVRCQAEPDVPPALSS